MKIKILLLGLVSILMLVALTYVGCKKDKPQPKPEPSDQIRYHDFNPDIELTAIDFISAQGIPFPQDSTAKVMLDLNFDGKNDMSIWISTEYYYVSTSNPAANYNYYSGFHMIQDGDSIHTTPVTYYPGILPKKFKIGDTITGNSHFSHGALTLDHGYGSPGSVNMIDDDSYFGFKIASGDGYIFGWIVLKLEPKYKLKIKEYAVNMTKNRGIIVENKYGNSKTVPLVTTKDATRISNSSAVIGGNVLENGGETVIERGVCYDTIENPTIASNYIQSGSGTGYFEIELNGLYQNTQYHYKAYAKNNIGVGYGEEKIFTTGGGVGTPSVTTTQVSNIKPNSVTTGGNVTDQGNFDVTSRGVCWSTLSNPTLFDSYTVDGSGPGSYISIITELAPNTTYYVCAYATNNEGTAYGEQRVFTTEDGDGGVPCPGIPTVTYQGQTYNTVIIGEQCWFKENLNYQTGNSWCYDDDTANCNVYGRLYDWETALSVCPDGWHLPSEDEFYDLMYFLGGWFVAGGKLKEAGYTHWQSPNTGAINSSGFTGLPGGYRDTDSVFRWLNFSATFWSSTVAYSPTNSWTLGLHNGSASSPIYNRRHETGYSVRCIKD